MAETKINNEGRGTYLHWDLVRCGSPGQWIVGVIHDHAGRCDAKPKLLRVYTTASGRIYVMLDGHRLYLH